MPRNQDLLVDRTVEHWTVFGVIDFAIHGSVQAGAVFTFFDSDYFVMVVHNPIKIALFYGNATMYFSSLNYKIDTYLNRSYSTVLPTGSDVCSLSGRIRSVYRKYCHSAMYKQSQYFKI